MSSPIFEFKPSFPPFFFYIILIIPVLCIPAGFVIYFTEGQNLAQLLSVSGGVGIGCPLFLYGLLKGTTKLIASKGGVTISEDGILRLKLNGKEEEFPLNSLTDVGLSGMPGAMNFRIIKKTGEAVNFTLPGNMTLEQEEKFKETIAKFNFS
jgi:hypothetical protein